MVNVLEAAKTGFKRITHPLSPGLQTIFKSGKYKDKAGNL